MEEAKEARTNFIWDFIDEDLKAGKNDGKVHTRFPPEPNGYLHIGHTKALYIDFMTAKRYDGLCNLRFDDTNPAKEDTEYVDGIQEDIRWMGFEWNGGLYYASDYYEKIYRVRRIADRARPGLCRRADARTDDANTAAPSPSRAKTAPGATVPQRKACSFSAICAPASSPRAAISCAPRSTWPRPT